MCSGKRFAHIHVPYATAPLCVDRQPTLTSGDIQPVQQPEGKTAPDCLLWAMDLKAAIEALAMRAHRCRRDAQALSCQRPTLPTNEAEQHISLPRRERLDRTPLAQRWEAAHMLHHQTVALGKREQQRA